VTEAEFLAAVLANEKNCAILARLPQLGLPDCWLVSGALFQSVWNKLTNRPPEHGIRDYDLFTFDPDTSWDAEDKAIRRTRIALADLGVEIELRNQARVHLWYEQKFGRPYPPLALATDGIDRFLMPCAQVGIRPANGTYAVYAPKGFADIAAMIVRPNVTANFNIDRFREKAERWQALWPEITILPG
jgi:hypothetical protein